ncbi:MAG: hypothetical protein C0594_09805 [Marinilabiliales bacterium]|nr:MAG: hypothetical protein C0594_09805 [Marinilabiliales bacterium]
MKKSALLIIAIMLISISGFAQKISGGLVVSPMLSWTKPEGPKYAENGKIKFGYNVGLLGDYNLGDNFAFSAGVVYNNYGGNIQYLDTIQKFITEDEQYDTILPNSIITYKMQFIEVPISIKGKTNEIGYITYFLRAGISPGFRYMSKATVENGVDDIVKGETIPAFALSVNIGGGIEYSLGGNTKLLVEAVYAAGLTDIDKVDIGISETKNEKISLNHFDLRIGILF